MTTSNPHKDFLDSVVAAVTSGADIDAVTQLAPAVAVALNSVASDLNANPGDEVLGARLRVALLALVSEDAFDVVQEALDFARTEGASNLGPSAPSVTGLLSGMLPGTPPAPAPAPAPVPAPPAEPATQEPPAEPQTGRGRARKGAARRPAAK